MSGIEFVEEVADQPPDRTPRRPRRWWLFGGGLVLALVLIWTFTRPVEHARPKPETVPTHAQVATSPPLAPEEELCRAEPNCARTTVVPPVLRQVINRYLPGRGSISVHSYLTKSIFDGATYLVARRIEVVAGPATVYVLVLRQVQANGPLPPVTTPYGVAPIVVRGDPFGYVVSLQYLAPLRASPSVARLRALAAEPGLESL